MVTFLKGTLYGYGSRYSLNKKPKKQTKNNKKKQKKKKQQQKTLVSVSYSNLVWN